MSRIKALIDYLQQNQLILATAESCTAGQIVALLGEHEGCGECLEIGYVVYTAKAKKSVLGVNQETIDAFSLTSEEVAQEMIKGALKNSTANIAIASTGLIGDESKDGKKPGTICLAWGAVKKEKLLIASKTLELEGSRKELQLKAAKIALEGVVKFYEDIKKGLIP